MNHGKKKRKNGWISIILCFAMIAGILSNTSVTVMADDTKETSIAQEAIQAMSKIFGKAKNDTAGVESSERNLVLIGDSRMVGMYMVMTGAKEVPQTASVIKTDGNGTSWSCRSGAGYEWMKSTGVPNAEAVLDENSDVIITMGLNDYRSEKMIEKYAPYINEKAKEWKKKGINTYFCSIMPIKGDNSEIEKDNDTIKNGLSDDVKYIDTYSAMKDSVEYTDHIHYKQDTYKQWYNQIVSQTKSQPGSQSQETKILKETNLADVKLEDMTCRHLNSNGREKDTAALSGKNYTDYTDTYTYVGKPENGGSENEEKVPKFKELSDSDKKGVSATVTFHVVNSCITQTYYSDSSTKQYLGEGTDTLVPEDKKIVGWTAHQSSDADAQGTGDEIMYATYHKLDKKIIQNMAAIGSGGELSLYAVLAGKTAKTKKDTIRVVTEDEYNGDLHDCFSSNPLSVRFAYVTQNGELQYTDKQDVTSYENQKVLYKTILAMATVATDNQTNTTDSASSSSSSEETGESVGSSSSEAEDTARTDEPEAYVKYCTEMAKKAIEGYQGYSVTYTPVLLKKVSGSDYDYTWTEDGVTYRSPGARLAADVVVYVDANLESLCAQDTMGEQWFHDNGMPSITSVFGDFVDFIKGLFNKNQDEEPVFWTKENRGYAKDYLDMSDSEFESWFHCNLNYGAASGAMIGTKYLEIMAEMAEGDNYLYSYGAGRPAGTESRYVDCAAFVARALYRAGVLTDATAWWTTRNMGPALVALGFTENRYTSMEDLQAGDILVVNLGNEHTETYYGDGKLVGAHSSTKPDADQVSIENFYEDGWQYYYRPPASMLTSIDMGTMTGNTVAEKLWSYFTTSGFSKTAAAAMLGNAMAESSMDPSAGTVAYGLFQFEMGTGNANGYYAYAAGKGKDTSDVQTQCEYLLQQLPDAFKSYTGNGVYYYSNGEYAWWPTAMTMDEWNDLDDVDSQTEIFERVYERASIPAIQRRQTFARQFLTQFGG